VKKENYCTTKRNCT